jgi:hypothetical protein
MSTVGMWIRGVITGLLFVAVLFWLWVIWRVIDEPVSQDINGNVLDQFQRSKDVLLVLLPLLTTALGYWFGIAGAEKADTRADAARQQAVAAQGQLAAVLDATTDKGLLKDAKELHGDAFPSSEQTGTVQEDHS